MSNTSLLIAISVDVYANDTIIKEVIKAYILLLCIFQITIRNFFVLFCVYLCMFFVVLFLLSYVVLCVPSLALLPLF